MQFRLDRSLKPTILALGLGGAVLLTGCGLGTAVQPTAQSAAISGVIHGGPNPVVGATVKIYSTGTTGYGTGSTLLTQTTSGQFGQFTFPANTCVAGSEVYVTAAGGNTGANTANPNSLLVSALGDCANVSSSTSVAVSELTTVAAAYALSNFTTVTGSGATTTVSIGAPAANAAATPLCTGTGTAMVCVASGLKHAFANALNLVGSVTTTAGAPTGTAYSTTPSNASGVVPSTLLNTIADILQSCVNSTGGVAGDGTTNCGTLFTNTTPPTTSTASAVAPTNTFQALVNLAKYPTMTPTQVTALYGLASSTAFFQPELGAAPTDFSVAIFYKGVVTGQTTTTFTYPFYVALDYNDNVYAADNTTSSAGPITIAGITSNGTSLFANASITAGACSASSACLISTDTAGHVWVPNYNTATHPNVYEVSTTDGSLTNTIALTGAQPNGSAVDHFNAVFVTSAVSAAAAGNVFQNTAAAPTTFNPVQVAGATLSEAVSPEAIAFDSADSLWNVNYASAATASTYIANSGTAATTFAAAPVVATETATVGSPYGIMIDGSNNGWVNNTKNLYEVAPGGTAPTVSAAISFTPAGGTAVVASSARYSALDGQGNIFLPDNNSSASKVWQFFPATNSFVYLFPCAASGTATACGTAAGLAVYGPRNAQIDSTGSIWVASSTNGNITQIIGTAAPTWPQLSYEHPGVRPQ